MDDRQSSAGTCRPDLVVDDVAAVRDPVDLNRNRDPFQNRIDGWHATLFERLDLWSDFKTLPTILATNEDHHGVHL